MRRPRAVLDVARVASLLALGALAVHQLRYLFTHGSGWGEALQREGHAYLSSALPVVVALATAALVAVLLRSAEIGAWRSPGARHRGASGWLLYATALFVVFSVQELAEGALVASHPAGLDAVLGGGAWVAAPLALAFGAVAALVERLLDRAGGALALVLAPRRPRPRPRRPARPAQAPRRAPLAALPLAFGLARRPPPAGQLT